MPKRFYEKLPNPCGKSLEELIDTTCSSRLRVDDVMMRRSVFWQVTCSCSRGMRNNMPEAAIRTENDQCREVVDHKAQLGSYRTFCHSAYRLLSLCLPTSGEGG